jgi:hypothetical protein
MRRFYSTIPTIRLQSLPTLPVYQLPVLAKMLAIFTVVAAFAAAAFALPADPVLAVNIAAPSATAFTAAGPDPPEVYINAITYGGTGCPQGSVGSFISADRQTAVSSGTTLEFL